MKKNIVGAKDRSKAPSLKPNRPEKVRKNHSVSVAEVVGEGENVSDRQCCVCERIFKSRKAMYGHLRSHPDRGWRGSKNLSETPVSPRLININTEEFSPLEVEIGALMLKLAEKPFLMAATTPRAAFLSPKRGFGLREEALSGWGLVPCTIGGHPGAENYRTQTTKSEVGSSAGFLGVVERDKTRGISVSGQSCGLWLTLASSETYCKMQFGNSTVLPRCLTEENPSASTCCGAVKAPALDLTLRL